MPIVRNPTMSPTPKDKQKFFFIRFCLFWVVIPFATLYILYKFISTLSHYYKITEDFIGSKILRLDRWLLPKLFPHLFKKI